jgi:Berberine and berberine like
MGDAVLGHGAPLGLWARLSELPRPGLANWAKAYHAGNHERLQRVKRTYDPDRLFRLAEQSL